MVSVVLIAWGSFDLPIAAVATALGWVGYAIGLAESYAATALYARDVRDMGRGSGDRPPR
jgi:hypothetical protein